MWQPLGNLLKKNFAGRTIAAEVTAAMALEQAQQIITGIFPTALGSLVMISYQNNILSFNVSKRFLFQELSMEKRKIARALSEQGIQIRDIRIRFAADKSFDFDSI